MVRKRNMIGNNISSRSRFACYGKKGQVIELKNIIIAIIVLLSMVAIITMLYAKGGGDILSSIKSIFKFGR